MYINLCLNSHYILFFLFFFFFNDTATTEIYTLSLHDALPTFGSWLYRIVANAACQKLRSRQSRSRDLSLDEVLPAFDAQGRHVGPMADWSARVDDHSVQTELRMALTSAINELPPVSRTVLVLRDVEGLSNLEIAEALGLSVPIVKCRVQRARLFLRKQLGDAMTTLDATVATSCGS